MKRIIFALLAAAVLLTAFSACSKDYESSVAESASNVASESAESGEVTDQSQLSEPKSEAELAMEMYDSLLSGNGSVVDSDDSDITKSLKDFILSINNNSESFTVNGKAVLDMDGDGINEVLLSVSSETLNGNNILLRYYNGRVFAWMFSFKSFYNLNTDGSFSWNSRDPFTYGEAKLTFVGSELMQKELWRIVNGDTDHAEYYINGEKVTQSEMGKYREENKKTPVEYEPFELKF